MHIVFVENIDPFRDITGGIGTYLKNLAGFLGEKDVETSLIGASGGNEDLKIPVKRFIDISDRRLSHPGFIRKLFFRVRRMTFDDGVIFHGQRPDVLVPLLLFKREYKYICTLHGIHSRAVYHKKGKIRGFIYELLERYTFRKAHLLIAVNEGTRDYYIDKYPDCKDKIVTVPIGVDWNVFKPKDKRTVRNHFGFLPLDKIILFVGRLEKEKNLSFLIDVFSVVRKKIRGCKLVIAGTGRQENELKTYAKNKGPDNIVFLGNVPNDRVPELLNCADVFAMCSLFEGSPTVIKEALSCNVPVVSTDAGDIKQVIGNINGCFIAKPEVADFSAKLMAILEQDKHYDLREQVSEYKNETVFARTLELYNQLKG